MNDVQTNVESKSVVVQAEESVSPQMMLEKLQAVSLVETEGNLNLQKITHQSFRLFQWSAASGKSVELA